MNPIAEDILMHYGVKKRSGRYPWGSGKDPYQHSGDFLSRVEELRKQGFTYTDEHGKTWTGDTAIAKGMGLSTTEFRVQTRLANHERRQLEVDRAKSLKADNLSNSEIGRIMGKNESTIRSLLDENRAANMDRAKVTSNILKEELQTKRILDVGKGAELELGVTKQTLDEAVYMLEREGYNRYGIGIPQVTNKGKQTNTEVICNPDIEYGYVYKNMGEIQSIGNYHSTDGGASYFKREYPSSIGSDRVMIRYGDEGGKTKDGVIELRRGVKDLDLGNSHYAQVRIMVDGTHYLKGMAMYSDNMPDGVDVVFNTNKKTGTDKMDVLKKIKEDPDNPFGATIKANGQSYYFDPNGKYTDPVTGKKQSLSAINKLKEEGDWDTSSSKNLSSQFLSKQPMPLIKKQLKITYDNAEAEFDEICELNNPTVKKKMLLEFADNCDGATVHLKAAALPRQKTQVILPIDQLKETEVYAPNYKNGEKLALIRYPHGGTFEIPVLTVNNKNKSAKSILGNVTDAIGINAKVAERLSGADFDGDTVVAIPTNDKVRIKSTDPDSSSSLRSLKDFDPKTKYPYREGMSVMSEKYKQKQMGIVSNLITDMTLKGAPNSDIVRAVKHSMVVIDAAKHKLDYKQSEKDNGIAELKKKWQIRVDDDGNVKVGGASTLISKRKQDVDIPERRGSGTIDPATGKVTYKESGRTYINKDGKITPATQKEKLMKITDDIHTLSSGTPQETAYADYANKMKALANKARKEYMATGKLVYSKTAKETYLAEVDSLKAKLNIAEKNAPRERRAQAIANSVVKAKMQDNPDMDKSEIKKLKNIELNNARANVGASGKNSRINITDREWAAIQAGAISDSKLSQILRYADDKVVRQLATPRAANQVSSAQATRIKAMAARGHTIAEIAEALGKSTSTVSKYLRS